MKINQKLLNKFNKFQNEVLEFYGLSITVYSNVIFYNDNKTYRIETFNIVNLGYKLSAIDNNDVDFMSLECLAYRLDYLRDNYPLLVPFYAITSYLTQEHTIQKKLKLTPETFDEINENVQFVRESKEL